MLRNLEKKVIFRAIITKKILHKNKKKTVYINFVSFYEPAILPIQVGTLSRVIKVYQEMYQNSHVYPCIAMYTYV